MKPTQFVSVFFLLAASALAQGPLNPPPGIDANVGPVNALSGGGAPQPTMKTLHQIEPRIPLSVGKPGIVYEANGGYTITAPGSYYLTANIVVASGTGVSIQAANVTLDLRGFAIICSATSGPTGAAGIDVTATATGTVIRDGHIASGTFRAGGAVPFTFSARGFSSGVRVPSQQGAAPLVENLSVTGCAGAGIDLSGRGAVMACLAEGNAGNGISASRVEMSIAFANGQFGIFATDVVESSFARENGTTGIASVVVGNCQAMANGGDGFSASTIAGSSALFNTGSGISTNGGIVQACAVHGNSSFGIQAYRGTVTGSVASQNGDDGIQSTKGSISSSFGYANAGEGLEAYDGSVSTSTATYNTLSGIAVANGTVQHSTSNYNTREGIFAPAGVVTGCMTRENGFWGISVEGGVLSFSVAERNGLTLGGGGMWVADANVSFTNSNNNTGQQYLTNGALDPWTFFSIR